ncbi:MAG: ribosome biogenesis GTP-binding protein YsxC [Alphaproteobacteria bacterium GM7ARS4]|nr:ribosome biogenesis GTP-binding protein YsxC [Alphaproteobacteria bacterium GM7ARS4]
MRLMMEQHAIRISHPPLPTSPSMTVRSLFAKDAWTMVRRATHMSMAPHPSHREIAFLGRSNVGKSSLLNALLYRKTLAPTSTKPGCTRALHFYEHAHMNVRLVDMPGYGYAGIGKKHASALSMLGQHYLLRRETLCCLFLLVDGRHGIHKTDQGIVAWLCEHAVPYHIVMTKCDKAKDLDTCKKSIETHQHVMRSSLSPIRSSAPPLTTICAVSVKSKEGLSTLRRQIAIRASSPMASSPRALSM